MGATVTGWTSHGHRIDGVASTSARPPVAVARCGGPAMCGTCAKEAYAQAHAQREAGRQGTGPMLSLATTRELLEEIVARLDITARLGLPDSVRGLGACVRDESAQTAAMTASRAADTALRSLPRDVLEYRTADAE